MLGLFMTSEYLTSDHTDGCSSQVSLYSVWGTSAILTTRCHWGGDLWLVIPYHGHAFCNRFSLTNALFGAQMGFQYELVYIIKHIYVLWFTSCNI